MGRFLNADALVSIGGLLGNNMFAYCNNNPISFCDPCGTCIHRWDFWEDCEQCAGKNLLTQIRDELSNYSGTYTQGISASGSLGFWSGGIQLGTSIDFKGNVEYQWSCCGGLSTGLPGGSVCAFGTATNAPDVTKLRGEGYNVGVSLAAGGALSIDGVIVPDNEAGTAYFGASVAGGLGGGADLHVTWGETRTMFNWKFNIFDVLEELTS